MRHFFTQNTHHSRIGTILYSHSTHSIHYQNTIYFQETLDLEQDLNYLPITGWNFSQGKGKPGLRDLFHERDDMKIIRTKDQDWNDTLNLLILSHRGIGNNLPHDPIRTLQTPFFSTPIIYTPTGWTLTKHDGKWIIDSPKIGYDKKGKLTGTYHLDNLSQIIDKGLIDKIREDSLKEGRKNRPNLIDQETWGEIFPTSLHTSKLIKTEGRWTILDNK